MYPSLNKVTLHSSGQPAQLIKQLFPSQNENLPPLARPKQAHCTSSRNRGQAEAPYPEPSALAAQSLAQKQRSSLSKSLSP